MRSILDETLRAEKIRHEYSQKSIFEMSHDLGESLEKLAYLIKVFLKNSDFEYLTFDYMPVHGIS